MNPNKLKELLKHIILEVNSQTAEGFLVAEMIANKDAIPEPFGAVNVEEGLFDGDVKKKAKELFGKVKKITKVSHPESNSEYFRITLTDPESHHTIRKDKEGKLSLGREEGGQLKFDQVEEETGTGAVAGYATPFAFKPTGGAGERRRKKKKKHIKEGIVFDAALAIAALTAFYKATSNFFDRYYAKRAQKDAQQRFQQSPAQKLKGIDVPLVKNGTPLTLDDLHQVIEIVKRSGGPDMYLEMIENAVLEEFRKGRLKTREELSQWIQKAIAAIRQQDQSKKPLKESHFLQKVKEKLVNVTEKTLPDGTYEDDMEDGRRSNRISGMNEGGTQYFAMVPVGSEFKIPGQPYTFKKIDKDTALLGKKKVKINNDTLVNIHGGLHEMTSSSAAGGQPGGTIQVPAWGTKNKLGSPKGIKGSEKLGYKVVRSITT